MSQVLPPSVTKLIEAFSRLPGIGPKTASRLTYYLLRAPDNITLSLAEALNDLKSKTRYCSTCHNITEDDPCMVCKNEKRDRATVVVVEDPLDVVAVERTGSFNGLYHVLHGAISPVEGIGPDDLRIKELVVRVQTQGIVEVIIATNPNMEGEATAMYIKQKLAPLGIKITRLARGLPSGGDLEYVDTVTLLRALQGRGEM
ncbi:MAG: recombination protein RecR [Chloroflexota bacterium]|nr:recombination protein RecR [Chloroflexota bacterium]NOG65652.1 recombination protein RecR [Chloroflexota bacterium]GIK66574.1 MAG: recombination protein RecR [Chloroflexota bacterium]